jgi:hypothetical protein
LTAATPSIVKKNISDDHREVDRGYCEGNVGITLSTVEVELEFLPIETISWLFFKLQYMVFGG